MSQSSSTKSTKLRFLYSIIVIIVIIITYGAYSVALHKYQNAPVSGRIEDSCIEAEKVDEINNKYLYGVLEDLIHRVFFKYFRVNYWRDCTIWPEDDFLCTASKPNERSNCELCSCDSEEVIFFLF